MPSMSSGDVTLDRRLSFAEGLLEQAEPAAAADLLRETVALAPDWGAGWFRYAEVCQIAGRIEDAARAFGHVLTLDPSDPFGAGLRLDLLREVPVVEQLPSAFVEQLFDQYAPRFETSLVQKLGYRGPELVMSALGPGRIDCALDMGCGTGLMGAALRPICGQLVGCDISAAMLRQAKVKGVYDSLQKQDLSKLSDPVPTYDLIVAADVFIYLGALERVVGWVAGALRPFGRFAFTVEVHDGPGFVLRESQRFAHSQSYITDLLAQGGFGRIDVQEVDLRKDRGAPVPALVVVGSGLNRIGDRSDEAAGILV